MIATVPKIGGPDKFRSHGKPLMTFISGPFAWSLRLLALLLAFSQVSALAMTIEFADSAGKRASASKGLPILLLSGEIKSGDNEKLERFVYVNRKDIDVDIGVGPVRIIVFLDSPGGDIEEALKLATTLKEMMAEVEVGPRTHCASSCFLLYVNAPIHNAAAGAVAVHRPYYPSEKVRDLSATDAARLHNEIYRGLKKWLQDRLVPQAIIEKMLGAPSSGAYELTREDLDAIGDRAAWYEEWLLARCPDYLRAEAEGKRLVAEGHELDKQTEDVLDCEADALGPEISAGLNRIGARQFQAAIKKYSKPKN